MQSWARFAWMHDNAIHDLPIAHLKRIAVSNLPPASLSTNPNRVSVFVIVVNALTSEKARHHRGRSLYLGIVITFGGVILVHRYSFQYDAPDHNCGQNQNDEKRRPW